MAGLCECSVVTSNLGFLEDVKSKGLNCSRIPFNVTFLPTFFSLLTPFCAFCFFCFFDCCGPVIPCSRKEAFNLLSCEGGIVWWVAKWWCWRYFFVEEISYRDKTTQLGLTKAVKAGNILAMQPRQVHYSTLMHINLRLTLLQHQNISAAHVVSSLWRRSRPLVMTGFSSSVLAARRAQ